MCTIEISTFPYHELFWVSPIVCTVEISTFPHHELFWVSTILRTAEISTFPHHELFLDEVLDGDVLGGHEDLIHVMPHHVAVAPQPLLAVQDRKRLVV